MSSIFHNGCNYLSMLGWRLNHVNKIAYSTTVTEVEHIIWTHERNPIIHLTLTCELWGVLFANISKKTYCCIVEQHITKCFLRISSCSWLNQRYDDSKGPAAYIINSINWAIFQCGMSGHKSNSWLILGLHRANERWHYFVTTPLIGWAQV